MNSLCLECLLLSVSAASAEFHEDLASAMAAVNSVSLSVKAFDGAAKRTLVVYKFRHSQTDLPIGFEPVRREINLEDRRQVVASCESQLPEMGLCLR